MPASLCERFRLRERFAHIVLPLAFLAAIGLWIILLANVNTVEGWVCLAPTILTVAVVAAYAVDCCFCRHSRRAGPTDPLLPESV